MSEEDGGDIGGGAEDEKGEFFFAKGFRKCTRGVCWFAEVFVAGGTCHERDAFCWQKREHGFGDGEGFVEWCIAKDDTDASDREFV